MLELLGIGELEPSNELIRTFNALLCDNSKRALHLCESLIFSLTGFDAANVNEVSAYPEDPGTDCKYCTLNEEPCPQPCRP